MILKSLTRKSGTGQLLRYLFKDEKKISDERQKPIIIRHNIRSRTIDKQIKEFKENEKFRLHKRKDSVKAYHTILSFSNKDKEKITEKTIRSVASQFMKLRGNDNLFIGTVHFDKDHVHLHMVMSGTKYLTGESNRLSRTEFLELKKSLDAWQARTFPELTHSLPRHGHSKEPSIDRQNNRLTQKESLLKTLESGYKKSTSVDSFLASIKTSGFEPYYRAGRLTGVRSDDGIKFRLGRLGYDEEKLAKLDQLQMREEKTLSEMRDIRERQSHLRDQDDERSSRTFEPEPDERSEKIEDRFTKDEPQDQEETENDICDEEDNDDLR
ncbi:MAG: relaxase/mobilization nuclease domain-containing protein [Bacteroidota bacterium]|nr:relaxase/mobilization nuclease domain-containing protein [Bacteroidota bacterium]